jgi:hypothetical protein
MVVNTKSHRFQLVFRCLSLRSYGQDQEQKEQYQKRHHH